MIKEVFLTLWGMMTWGLVWCQIPTVGEQNRLDVATWNIEWFGNVNNGPSNEDLQLENVSKVVNATDLDIIALQEISDDIHWGKLLDKCADYSGVKSTWSQVQKTGLLYKTSEFNFVYQKHILPNYDYDFAGGRLPLEVGLIPKNSAWSKRDTLRIWVLHLKANTGTTSQKIDAYNRRYNAALALKLYIDGLPKGTKGLIMGDWNDDFDQSIISGYSTPFPSWTKDTQYAITSLRLSLTKQRSTVSYAEMIDHIVCTPGLKSHWVKDSSLVLPADRWISSYGSNTSDHYPIFTRFKWESPQMNSTVEVLRNPIKWSYSNNQLAFSSGDESVQKVVIELNLYDLSGRLIAKSNSGNILGLNLNQWYVYQINLGQDTESKGLVMINDNGTICYR